MNTHYTALCVLPAFVCAAPALAEIVGAVRGLATSVSVDYAPRLRARADLASTSPILIRVSPSETPGSQRIEFIGSVAGSFDLRDFLEREDGKPLTDLEPLSVKVVSNLPADHGTDLYGASESWLNWRAHYRELMWGAVALWVAVPVGAWLVHRARRPRPAPPVAPAPPPPSLSEQLRAALEAARDRSLSVEESAKLELLLYRYLGGDAENADGRALAALLQRVREQERTRPLVLAVERWLHAKDGGEEARGAAAAALDQLRGDRLAAYAPPSSPSREPTAVGVTP
ncbi:MAG: hypothetical protein QM783_18460 [Phycisphaerales bacterium]